MLIDQIEACVSTIEELSHMKENAQSIDAFESAVNKLHGVGDTAEAFASTIEEMAKYDFCALQYADEDTQELQNALISCVTAVNNMSLTKANVATLTGLLDTEKKKVTLFWQTVAKNLVDPIKSILGIIQPFSDNKTEVSNLITALTNGSKSEPSVMVVRSLAKNVERANAVSEEFQMSAGIRSFLQKAKAGKATYADITPVVARWIAEHKLKAKIKISFI